jgi:hypothetical protein
MDQSVSASSPDNVPAKSSPKPRPKKTNFPADRMVFVFPDGLRFEIIVKDLEKFLTGRLPKKKCLHVSDLHKVLDLLSIDMQSQLMIDIILSYVGTREKLESAIGEGLKILRRTNGTVLIFCGLKQKLDIPNTVLSTEELYKIVVANLEHQRIENGTKGQFLGVLASMGYDSYFIDDCKLNAGGAMVSAIRAKNGPNPRSIGVTYACQPKGQSLEKSCEDIMSHFVKYGAIRLLVAQVVEPEPKELVKVVFSVNADGGVVTSFEF